MNNIIDRFITRMKIFRVPISWNIHTEKIYVFMYMAGKSNAFQEFGRLSVNGHHLQQEGNLYYLVQDKTQIRRRHFSSLVPPLGFKNQFLIVR